MADARSILIASGMGLVDDLIRGAQLEGVPLPIAATVAAGESWGRNIWGADGGLKVRTNGTYTPHTLVTEAAYKAYRAEMRAGRIIRQGCGPLQCTSAQYQDTADALGGCWVPLANYRSGFRGMGALMRQYGTRGGARRYNGSGERAEAYAASFMKRLAIWQDRLAGAAVPNVSAPAAQPLEDDLPSVPDVWSHPIDNPFTAQGGDWMPAHATLGWAAAHAAFARQEAAEARKTADRCEAKLDAILARLG